MDNADGGWEVMQDAIVGKSLLEISLMSRVALCPGGKIMGGGKVIGLRGVATGMREDKVVAKIHRILGPGNEVVHLPPRRRQRSLTIETPPRLDAFEDLAHGPEIGGYMVRCSPSWMV
jgi:hypothetical protein